MKKGLKSYPCGSIDFGYGNTTVLQPGVNLLSWVETISHDGSPFRIALSYNDDSHYDSWILVDHSEFLWFKKIFFTDIL